MGPQDNTAIILSDLGNVTSSLTYNNVNNIRALITNFITQHVKEEHQCIGLRMTHNIYIPSIILSLQELHHAFIFLPEEKNESEGIIRDLGLMWLLSFTPCDGTVGTLVLNNVSLFLIQNSFSGKKYQNIYYIIRTSGSTGVSKYVKVTKQCIESNIKDLSRIFQITEGDMIYFGTPLTFDPSMVELLLALDNKGSLLITTPKNKINPNRLHQTLIQNRVSVLQIVPSLFLHWSQEQIDNLLNNPNLRILAFGGEPFPHSVLNYKKSNSLRIFNLYGVTEVSCWATIYEVPSKVPGEIPLGGALDETLIQIRDDCGNTIANGEGEIYIGSSTRICHIDDEKVTIESPIFRATGDLAMINQHGIFYTGRKNDVFKRLGHKIHLNKIEETVKGVTTLDNRCVWLKSHSRLLLFLIIENFDEKTKEKVLDRVRVKLLHSLPKHYFPDFIDIVRKCPVTSHGKTNKKVLESLYLNKKTNDRKQAVEIFKVLISKYFGLDVDKNSVKSTFFELGGNSILAMQFLGEFEEELGAACPDLVGVLFDGDISACIEILKNVKLNQKRPQITESGPMLKRNKGGIELKIAWKYNLEACVDSSPLIFNHGDQILVAVGSHSHVFAVLDANTGAEVAKFILPDAIESTPFYFHNLYVSCSDGTFYCLDFTSNTIKWSYETTDRLKCTPVLCFDAKGVVFGGYDKHVHCLRVSNGTLIWKTLISEGVTSTPLVLQQKVYIATISGTCLCLSENDGLILWRYKSESPIFGAPCTLNGSILWPNVHGSVICLTVEGQKKWQYHTVGHLYYSLRSYEDFIVFASHNHNLYLLREVNGAPKATIICDLEDALTTPLVVKDFIVVLGNSGHLFLVNFEGVVLAELDLPGQVFSSVINYSNHLFFGCRDNNLYCVLLDFESLVKA